MITFKANGAQNGSAYVVSGVRCIKPGKTFDQLLPSFLIASENVSGASGADPTIFCNAVFRLSGTLGITRFPRSSALVETAAQHSES